MLPTLEPWGKSSMTSTVLVFQIGTPRRVNTWGQMASDLEYLVSGKAALELMDRLWLPAPRYWT
jgi:hypothetical protein